MMIAARPATRSYELCGLAIEVTTDDARADEQVTELLSAFPVVPLTTATQVPDLTLSVAWTDRLPPTPYPPDQGLRCYGVTLFDDRDTCCVADEYALFEFNRRAGVGRIRLHPTFSRYELLRRHSFFLLGLMQGLLGRGFFDLHAAGLVKDGIGYLLVGEPASGKSSAALSLACLGWGYLSDDALLLKRGSDGVEAFGFRRKFCIDPRLGEYWPAVAGQLQRSVGADQPKQFVDLTRLYPHRLHESVVPGVLIFTGIVDGPHSRLLPLDQTAALLRLLRQSASLGFNRNGAAEHLSVLRDLVAQTNSYELRAGRDLYEAPGKIAELLETIQSSSITHCATGRRADRRSAMPGAM